MSTSYIFRNALLNALLNNYLSKDTEIKKWQNYFPSSEKVTEKIGSVVNYCVGDYSIQRMVNSSVGRYVIKTKVKPFVEDILEELMKEALDKDFQLKLNASINMHMEGISLVGFTNYRCKYGLAMKIKKFNPTVEANFSTRKKTVGLEFLLKQFEWPLNVPFINSTLADIPVKLKLKPECDFGEKTISISAFLAGGKLFEIGANLNLTWPYYPSLGASVMADLGWFDAAISVKRQGIKVGGNFNPTPDIGFHIMMKHDKKRTDTMTKASVSIGGKHGGRKFSCNPCGFMIVETKIEQPKSSLMWKVKYDIKEKRVGLKMAYAI